MELTPDEIKKGKVLIAAFMNIGYKRYDNWGYFFYDKVSGDIVATDILFNSSWDILMPVVEKIENINYVSVYFSKTYLGIHKVEISLHTPNYVSPTVSKTVFIENNNRLEATFRAVVEFIKWYNTNK